MISDNIAEDSGHPSTSRTDENMVKIMVLFTKTFFTSHSYPNEERSSFGPWKAFGSKFEHVADCCKICASTD
jgi:hypothetical protein